MNDIIGDNDGIDLWYLMYNSNDKKEQEYFSTLQLAATKHGSVWFTDTVTQRETEKPQAWWYMEWTGSKWSISLFDIPNGAQRRSPRLIKNSLGEEVELIDMDADITEEM